MTASNHVTTGAVIALVIKQPAAAVPLAFASHFVLDAIPHYGANAADVFERNRSWLFRTVIAVDVPLMFVLLFLLPHLSASVIAPWIVLACMIAAISPDFIWVFRFTQEVITQKWTPRKWWFTRFHKSIQWFEKPIGLVFEQVWFVGMLLIFDKLVT